MYLTIQQTLKDLQDKFNLTFLFVANNLNVVQYFSDRVAIIREGKILELESTIANAEIIDATKLSGGEIKFGATITIKDDETSEKSTYQIVGEYESDINNKKLSINSPLARGLIGKTKDDIVEVVSPKGTKSYSILSVKFI